MCARRACSICFFAEFERPVFLLCGMGTWVTVLKAVTVVSPPPRNTSEISLTTKTEVRVRWDKFEI